MPLVALKGDPGPQGEPGVSGGVYGPEGPRGIGPALTYSGDSLTTVTFDGGDYKTLTYTGANLTRVDWVMADKIIRKDLVYAGEQLSAVNQSIIPQP